VGLVVHGKATRRRGLRRIELEDYIAFGWKLQHYMATRLCSSIGNPYGTLLLNDSSVGASNNQHVLSSLSNHH